MTNATLILPWAGLDRLQLAYAGYLGRYHGATLQVYEYYLKTYFDWCTSHSLHPLDDVTRAHVEFYVRHLLEERGMKASTVNTAMTPVKGFYDFAVWDEHITRDPARRVALPKARYEKSKPLTRRELDLFLEIAKESSPRHWALVALLTSMALRISEATHLRIENYRGLDAGLPTLTYLEKGGNMRETPIPLPLLAPIEAVRAGRTEGPMIPARDGVTPLTRGGASGLVETVNRRAQKEGLKRHVNPHLLRKMAITTALESNMPIRDVQEFARHADPRTTSRHYDLGRANHHRHPVHQIASQLAV